MSEPTASQQLEELLMQPNEYLDVPRAEAALRQVSLAVAALEAIRDDAYEAAPWAIRERAVRGLAALGENP